MNDVFLFLSEKFEELSSKLVARSEKLEARRVKFEVGSSFCLLSFILSAKICGVLLLLCG